MFRLRIHCSADIAPLIVGALDAPSAPEAGAVGAFELGSGWVVEGFYADEPAASDIIGVMQRAGVEDAGSLRLEFEPLADRDWVSSSFEAMPPVHAGRFCVYGGHARDHVPANLIGIEIEANMAFLPLTGS